MEQRSLSTAVVAALRAADGGALTIGELRAAVGGSPGDVEQLVAELEAVGALVTIHHAPFDRHLEGVDLRTIAAVDSDPQDAVRRAEQRWNRLAREFLASHRCT